MALKPSAQNLKLLSSNGMRFKRLSTGVLIYTKNGKGMDNKQLSICGKVTRELGIYNLPK